MILRENISKTHFSVRVYNRESEEKLEWDMVMKGDKLMLNPSK